MDNCGKGVVDNKQCMHVAEWGLARRRRVNARARTVNEHERSVDARLGIYDESYQGILVVRVESLEAGVLLCLTPCPPLPPFRYAR